MHMSHFLLFFFSSYHIIQDSYQGSEVFDEFKLFWGRKYFFLCYTCCSEGTITAPANEEYLG